MKKLFYLFSLLMIICLSGCLKTFYPIFHESDVVYNENFLGKWKLTNQKGENAGYYIITRISEPRKAELAAGVQKISAKGYFITTISTIGDTINQYFAFLAKIGNNEYFDFYPAEMSSEKNINPIYKIHHIKFHSSYKCLIKDKNHFNIRMFDQGFLEQLIAKNQINIRYEKVEDETFITASTDELQKFILKYNENPNAYEDDITFCERLLDL